MQRLYKSSTIQIKSPYERFCSTISAIDPLSINKQGNDRGRQYRTGVYYTDEADREVIAHLFAGRREATGPQNRG